ncbi:MAG: UDP-N-acetylglucosamine 2-epimerase (non-hydrolyzing) [Clostridia bacterium]|nr:UDP-N-acetylglucosamine 2-epimerase (non-hydrolyzing) [Clostridia bacterium]
MKTILLVFGTRPEAIKMCPLVKELKSRAGVKTLVCVTGQHREMLDAVLDSFDVTPDFDLNIMKPRQTLFDVTSSILNGMHGVFEQARPDLVLVHGDTTTAFVASLAAFYERIPVGHVEAGLRTYDLYSPYPEEFNRQAISLTARYHFAPTEKAKENLLAEGKEKNRIFVTGNTAIDALRTTVRKDYSNPTLNELADTRILLMTAHRRENLGEPMRGMFRAIRRIVEEYGDVSVVYPVHLNPAVRSVADEIFGGLDRVRLIEPLDVLDFHNFLARCCFVMTDSGGIQEEAPSLGKPVLVMRDTTERPEGVAAGTLRLVGTAERDVYEACKKLLDDPREYEKMAKAVNPYGDGRASERIADIILDGKEGCGNE